MNWQDELAKKVKYQSIIIIIITFIIGGFLLWQVDNSISSPGGILGVIAIGFGLLFAAHSFFTNQAREHFEKVIKMMSKYYESIIKEQRSGHKEITEGWHTLSNERSNSGLTDNGYKTKREIEGETEES